MYPKISTVINYCSNDYQFLRPCINSVIPFSKEVIVSYCDHFFDGEPENNELIETSINKNPNATFVCFSFDSLKNINDFGLMHNRNRAIGWAALKEPVDWILFLDCDEVADPIFYQWLKEYDVTQFESYRIGSYWYYREPRFQAVQHEDSAVLTLNKDFTFENLCNSAGERLGVMHNKRAHGVYYSCRRLPMFHHYSWVGDEKRLLRKVKSWGHTNNKDWATLIKKDFKRQFTKTCRDPVHNYSYLEIKPLI
jgi:hypothetical protein